MGLQLTVPYPVGGPRGDVLALLPEGAGGVLDSGRAWSKSGEGELVVTSRGLIACDPSSGEITGMLWSTFDASRQLFDCDSYACIAMHVPGYGELAFGIDYRLAANIWAIASQLDEAGSEAGAEVDRVVTSAGLSALHEPAGDHLVEGPVDRVAGRDEPSGPVPAGPGREWPDPVVDGAGRGAGGASTTASAPAGAGILDDDAGPSLAGDRAAPGEPAPGIDRTFGIPGVDPRAALDLRDAPGERPRHWPPSATRPGSDPDAGSVAQDPSPHAEPDRGPRRRPDAGPGSGGRPGPATGASTPSPPVSPFATAPPPASPIAPATSPPAAEPPPVDLFGSNPAPAAPVASDRAPVDLFGSDPAPAAPFAAPDPAGTALWPSAASPLAAPPASEPHPVDLFGAGSASAAPFAADAPSGAGFAPGLPPAAEPVGRPPLAEALSVAPVEAGPLAAGPISAGAAFRAGPAGRARRAVFGATSADDQPHRGRAGDDDLTITAVVPAVPPPAPQPADRIPSDRAPSDPPVARSGASWGPSWGPAWDAADPPPRRPLIDAAPAAAPAAPTPAPSGRVWPDEDPAPAPSGLVWPDGDPAGAGGPIDGPRRRPLNFDHDGGAPRIDGFESLVRGPADQRRLWFWAGGAVALALLAVGLVFALGRDGGGPTAGVDRTREPAGPVVSVGASAAGGTVAPITTGPSATAGAPASTVAASTAGGPGGTAGGPGSTVAATAKPPVASGVTTTRPAVTTIAPSTSAAANCHPAYRPCLPNKPGDAVNCADIPAALKPVTVIDPANDPYRLQSSARTGKAC